MLIAKSSFSLLWFAKYTCHWEVSRELRGIQINRADYFNLRMTNTREKHLFQLECEELHLDCLFFEIFVPSSNSVPYSSSISFVNNNNVSPIFVEECQHPIGWIICCRKESWVTKNQLNDLLRTTETMEGKLKIIDALWSLNHLLSSIHNERVKIIDAMTNSLEIGEESTRGLC